MNGRLSTAGRASHYGTQFWRTKTKFYPTRDAMLKAHSKKSLERRLVLPLDAHNWPRALEVLNAKYARLGRTPEHYKQVIRNMVEGVMISGTADGVTSVSSHKAREVAVVLDDLCAQAYAEEIPVNRSLWVTLLWAYCVLGRPDAALECYAQARKRFPVSPATLGHMTEILLPVLAQHGRLQDARTVWETYVTASTQDTTTKTPASHGRRAGAAGVDEAAMRRWMAEAAARAGDWQAALASLDALEVSCKSATSDTSPRAVEALFVDDEVPPLSHSHAEGSSNRKEAVDTFMSRAALRKLFRALATAKPEEPHMARNLPGAHTGSATHSTNVTERMLACWDQLYGKDRGSNASANPQPPPAEDVQCLLNGLAAAGRWEAALDAFATFYLGYANGAAGLFQPEGDAASRTAPDTTGLPLDADALGLVFASFPSREVEMVATEPPATDPARPAATTARTAGMRLTVTEHPKVVVRLLDVLLLTRDDMILTDRVMAVVAPALLQLGEVERCLQLLRHAPCFTAAASKEGEKDGKRIRAPRTPEEKHLRGQLCNIVYAIHGATTTEMKYAAVMAFPFLFPPEMLKRLPPPDQMPDFIRAEAAAYAQAQNAVTAMDHESDNARYDTAMQSRTPSSVRPSRHHYFPNKASTSELTEKQETKLQRQLYSQRTRAESAFALTGKDADADPRPIPKGLHDTASGWNFYGRGGEMVFANNKRIPHPFSMQPKVMRSLANPYRGWNPRQNSSLAHKESVVKWNGNSAV